MHCDWKLRIDICPGGWLEVLLRRRRRQAQLQIRSKTVQARGRSRQSQMRRRETMLAGPAAAVD